MQSQSSFAIFVFGLIALNAAKVSVWVVVFLAVFLPVLLTPLLLRLTIWRDTKAVSLEDLPRFTPETGFLPTIFNAAKEGAELLFLLIIPSCAVVFAAIGALDHFGLWTGIQAGINTPPLVVGSYILASSGFPLQVIFGQIPAIWSGCTDLTEREAMTAAIIGAVIKVLTAALFATCLQFLYM